MKPLLEAKGVKVLTTRDEEMLGVSDIQQMNHAVQKGYVFLTHNRADFEWLYLNRINVGRNHSGVVLAARRNVY